MVNSEVKPPRREGGAYSVEAVERAIDVLMAFTHAEPELTLSQIVNRTKLPKSTVFRLLATLRARHLCQLDPATGKYTLGYELLKMADIRARQINFRRLVLPIMQELRDVSNETMVLSVRDGDDRVNIDYVESRDPLRRVPEPGRRAPLYSGAASKAFLAFMQDQDIEDYLARTKLEQRGPSTITDPAELRRDIAKIRRVGYAESRGEQTPQGNAIAAPVFDHTGEALCVISISYVDSRFTQQIRKKSIAGLLELTRRVSRELGARLA
jgi:DNA-binding IclR family transcriptional regulator